MKKWLAKVLDVKPEIKIRVNEVPVEVEVVKFVDVPGPVQIKEVYKVVEVSKRPDNKEWDKNTRDAVASLSAHPGFRALMDRFATQQAMMETKLKLSHHKELAEVNWLQAAIYWLGFADEQVNQAVKYKQPKKQLDAFEEELEAFKQIDASIERVG